MKVYLVYWCNNEPWEDYSEMVDGVFSTRENAISFIEGKGYRLRTDPNDICVKRGIDRWDWRCDEWETYSMWVREMEVDVCNG